MKTFFGLYFWRFLLCIFCCWVFIANAENKDVETDSVLRLGIFYPPISDTASRADVAVSFSLWIQEQSSKVGVRAADVILFDDIDEMSEAFETGKINLISAPPLTVALHFNRNSLSEGIIGLRGPGLLNSILVLARTDKGINAIKDMRGKRLIIPENQELVDVFLDALVLRSEHIPYKKLFSSITTEKKDKSILLDLFFDKADVAVVYEGAYELMKDLNPQFNEKFKIIDSYPTKSKSYFFVHKNYPFRQKIIDNYLRMITSVRGRQFLNLFQQEILERVNVSDLDAYDALYQEHKQLLKKYRGKH